MTCLRAQPTEISCNFTRWHCFVVLTSMTGRLSAKPSNCNVNCCILLLCLAVQGSALRGLIPRKRGELLGYPDILRSFSSSASRQEHSPPERKACQAFECGSFRTSLLFPPASRRGAPSPMRQRKRQPSLSLNKVDFVRGLVFYWVATAIGVVRPLAGLGSMDIKNALSHHSGVFHRPRSEPLYFV